MPFPDGKPPPDEVLRQWVDLVSSIFRDEKDSCIAVHCVAGLGRCVSVRPAKDQYRSCESHQAHMLLSHDTHEHYNVRPKLSHKRGNIIYVGHQ